MSKRQIKITGGSVQVNKGGSNLVSVKGTVDNLRIRGIQQRLVYYEQVFDPMSQSFRYNAWVQLAMPRADYVKAKIDAAERLVDKAVREKDEKAKEKALDLLEKLRQEA
jgi:hypothetical protein